MEGLFNQYDNNPWSHYSIQLSTYCLMLKKLYPGYEIENVSLVWLEQRQAKSSSYLLIFSLDTANESSIKHEKSRFSRMHIQ